MNHLLYKSIQRDSVWIHAFKQDSKEDVALVLKNEWVLKKWSLLNPGEKSIENEENGKDGSDELKDKVGESGEVKTESAQIKAESEELKEESNQVKEEGIELSNETTEASYTKESEMGEAKETTE